MCFESRNPATGEVVAGYPEHTSAEVETCLARAWSGWKSWSATPLAARTAFTVLTRLRHDTPIVAEENSGFGRELGALGARELANAKLVWQGS